MVAFSLHDIAQMLVNDLLVDTPSTSTAATHEAENQPSYDGSLPTTSTRVVSDSQAGPSHGNSLEAAELNEWSQVQMVVGQTSHDEWAVSYADHSEPFKNFDQPYRLISFKDEQESILDRLDFETKHDIFFHRDLFDELYLDTLTSGMQEGRPTHQENLTAPDFNNLGRVFADNDVAAIVENLKRTARLPIGPTASSDISEKKRCSAFGSTSETQQGETRVSMVRLKIGGGPLTKVIGDGAPTDILSQLENFVVLSDKSTSSDPLKIFSVHVNTDPNFVKDLVEFRKRYVDTSEKLHSKREEKLPVHFDRGNYSILLGMNGREVHYGGNDSRSFVCSSEYTITDTINQYRNIPGIYSIRPLNEQEQAAVAKIYPELTGPCRIEFDSFRSYDTALRTHAVEYGWKKFPLIGSPEMKIVSRQLCMQLKWFMWPSKRQAVIELNREAVSRCIYVLEKHDLLVSDMTAEWAEDEWTGKILIKGEIGAKFHRMWHYEMELKHVLDKIFRCNNIPYIRISMMRKKQQEIDEEIPSIITEVNRRIIRSAFNCGEPVWSHHKVPDDDELDALAENSSQLPWGIIVVSYCVKGVEAVIEVQFDDEVFGRAIVDYMMPRTPDSEFFSLFYQDRIGVRVFPFYRVTVPVPKKILSACIPDLSKTVLYFGDAEPDRNSTSANKYGTRNSFARISASDRADGLTVEMWPERIIPGALATLNTVLEGRTFDCSREPYAKLLFGRGLEWLADLAELSDPYVVLRVDRLKSRLVLYGSSHNIDTFVERINYFCTRTNQFVLFAEISLGLPRFLPCIPRVIARIYGRQRLSAHFGEISFNHEDLSIKFRGSLEKLNQLNCFLDALNEQIVLNTKKSTGLQLYRLNEFPQFTYSRPICPVCASTVQLSSFCLDNCGHYYCLECLADQIQYQTRQRQLPWKCLYQGCEKDICISDVKELLCLNKNIPMWYIQQDLQQFMDPLRDIVIRDGTSGYVGCDTPNCQGLYKNQMHPGAIQHDDDNVDQPTTACSDCGVVRCLNCLSFAHDGISCWRHAQIQDDADVSLAHFKERNKNARNCPTVTCGAVIMKDDGCNHVFCPYCKTHFCWVCFRSFESSQDVYSHMHNAHGGFGGGWVIENNVVLAAPFQEALLEDD